MTGRITVLVADDDKATRTLLNRYLTSMGYEVIEAADGAQAQALAVARRPDIILLDIFMPGKDGIEALKELAPKMPGTSFLIITGGENEAGAQECLVWGADDYILKPLDMEAVGRAIKTRLLLRGL